MRIDHRYLRQATLAIALTFQLSVCAGDAPSDSFLTPWVGANADWDAPLMGGRILMDGAVVWQGKGEKINDYLSDLGAFTAWDLQPGLAASAPAQTGFVTFGTLAGPHRMSVLVIDLIPADGADHQFEVHLPASPGLKVANRLVRDYSAATFKQLQREAPDYLDWRYKYLQWYEQSGENFCADLLLHHAQAEAPGWLMLRVVHPVTPWDDYARPATWEAATDDSGGTLILPTHGEALRLTVLFVGDNTRTQDKPRLHTAWRQENAYVVSSEDRLRLADSLTELQVNGTTFLNFRRLPGGRTVFQVLAAMGDFAVGWDDDKDELDGLLDDLE
jgi:hypothetical protein